MKTAEKTGRFLFVLFLLLCTLILTLPCRGITVDIVLSGSMEPGIKSRRNCVYRYDSGGTGAR